MSHTLLLVRHCQATGQAPDAPLTPTGEAQARLLADVLAPEGILRIVSSPFRRAVQSAAPLAARLALPLETDVRLAERVLCGDHRADWRELLAATFDDPDLCWPGGESSRAAVTRALTVLDEALAREARTTLLVTHGNLLALLLQHYGASDGFASWAALRNPDVYRLHLHDHGHDLERLELPGLPAGS